MHREWCGARQKNQQQSTYVLMEPLKELGVQAPEAHLEEKLYKMDI